MNLITLGTYDGVHLGHRTLVKDLVSRARRLSMRSLVVLFPRPPRVHFHPELAVPLLTTPEERAALLKALGVDRVVVLPFDGALAGMEAERFLDDVLVRRLKAGGLVIGADFALGKGRRGDAAFLKAACRERGLKLYDKKLLVSAAGKISSTAIRERLLAGDLEAANAMLGRPYRLAGEVVRGAGLGRKLGFPTANLRVAPGKLLPPGVFEVRAELGARRLAGVANIGLRPTVGGSPAVIVEAHLLGFDRPLYGRRLVLDLMRRLRGERKFPGLDALREQIRLDVASVRPLRRA